MSTTNNGTTAPAELDHATAALAPDLPPHAELPETPTDAVIPLPLGPQSGALFGTPLDLAPILPTLGQMAQIEGYMNAVILEREQVIRGLLVAITAGEHLVLLGPPGTAKSLLMRTLAECLVDPLGTGGVNIFAALMTKFTKPEELFGLVSVAALAHDEYRYLTAKHLPEAHLGLLDEIFKGSSAILNTLLTLINERTFQNGDTTMVVPLISLIAASNEAPADPSLAAIWDRLPIRFMIEHLSPGGRMKLLQARAQNLTHRLDAQHALAGMGRQTQVVQPPQISLDDLFLVQQFLPHVYVPQLVLDKLIELSTSLKSQNIVVSDRRWDAILSILRAHALLEGRGVVNEDDLPFLAHVLWDTPGQAKGVQQLVGRLANPVTQRGKELADQAASVIDAVMKAYKDQGLEDTAKTASSVDGMTKLRSIQQTLATLIKKCKEEKVDTTRLEAIAAKITEQQKIIQNMMFQETA